ncbi:efflux RND transporter permease subunit [Leptolyngbya sp. NIES-2104]|uniref:efflux RND transporter permease subunit n=1 Tax=Leptolyngbya sp. NIES-2104 TaxID=1552121 RepID=UPI0006ECC355|nr:efflux RND transporter permease subunit [Leptolyngbya sp. NIES-2104]GAP99152.1 AcrB/AcrD/AcrF family protein [Leptolyngbya sp. NIES-2104]
MDLPTPPTSRERFNISRIAIAKPALTICIWIFITVAGLFAFSSLKYALFPDITFPVVVVNAQAPLTVTTETEKQVTAPIEQALKSIEGLNDLRSSTFPNQTAVSLSFAVGTSLEESGQRVEAAMKSVTLPKDSKYTVTALNLNESAAVSYAIESTSRNLQDLVNVTNNQIVPQLTKIPGVLKVNVLGAGGNEQGATLTRFNGKDALSVQVIKRGNANTLEVVDAAEKEIATLRQNLSNVTITLAATQAEFIRRATHSTIEALIEAIVLSIIVIFPFLRSWRATLISALAIPISLLGTFIVMAFFGFNLETITLLALALVIGSVVDDAIVDVENISRHIEDGATPREAALHATNEIGLTVTAATFTAVAVFLPIGLMGGVIGQFFKPFGITVSAAMIMSLLVARTLSPVLSIYMLRKRPGQNQNHTNGIWSRFSDVYYRLLRWSLRHRLIVVGIAIASFAAGIAIIPMIPQGFIPKLDRGEFNVRYTAPLPQIPPQEEIARIVASGGQVPQINPLQDSLNVAKQLEDAVRKSPDVQTIFTTVGSREGEPNKGLLYVRLKDDRSTPTATVQDQLRSTLPQISGVSTSVEDIPFVEAGSQKPLQAGIKGDDLTTLEKAGTDLKNRLQTIPGIVDVTLSGSSNRNGLQQIDRRNGQRVVYVSANLGKDLSLGDATNRLVEESKPILPVGVTLSLGGDSASSQEIFGSFGKTLGLSALCIVIVLVWLFRSLIDPIVVALSLPLALVGAMLALLITQSDFGMISLIGFVFLLGLTNKNAILIVDYINQLRREGYDRNAAILQAGPIRLRPIMMTTAATILGMVPIAIGLGAGSELRSPMAVAIAGGLITSTLLSLFVVPVVYTLLDDLKPGKRR